MRKLITVLSVTLSFGAPVKGCEALPGEARKPPSATARPTASDQRTARDLDCPNAIGSAATAMKRKHVAAVALTDAEGEAVGALGQDGELHVYFYDVNWACAVVLANGQSRVSVRLVMGDLRRDDTGRGTAGPLWLSSADPLCVEAYADMFDERGVHRASAAALYLTRLGMVDDCAQVRNHRWEP